MKSLNACMATMLVGLAIAACGGTEPELRQVAVSGALTSGGQPAVGSGFATLGVTGESAPVATVFADFDGTYAISGQVDASDCGLLNVTVALQAATGQIVGQATESLASCGTHKVDLELSP